MKNSLSAKSKDIARRLIECDAQCKRILSRKAVLARILKEYMTEYAECSLEDIREKYIEGTPKVSKIVVHQQDVLFISGVNAEDASPNEGKVIYDILFTAKLPNSEERVGLIINIEAQTTTKVKYPLTKRAFYYCSRLISSQNRKYFRNSNYGAIRKVYSLWVILHPQKKYENTVTKYSITEQNIVGNFHEAVENYDLMTVVIVGVGEYKQKDYQETLRMLNVLLREDLTKAERHLILKNDYNDILPAFEEDEGMSNIGLDFYREGRAEGREEGRAEGLVEGEAIGEARGHAKGTENGLSIALKNLMKNMNMSISAAMDVLGISQSERPKYEAIFRCS